MSNGSVDYKNYDGGDSGGGDEDVMMMNRR